VLDHEYGASGGILSILPTAAEHDDASLAAARDSLVGQWILFSQHLVARMHDLEIAYGNALDLLAGEAAVPRQLLSKTGPGGGGGREIAYPQDRWVLANAGDDIFGHLHRLMDREEALIDAKERVHRKSGVAGERTWRLDHGGAEYARGIVPLDVTTRYYRLRDQGSDGIIFVLPAWSHHPGVEGTRRLEDRPTVVSVPAPIWPQRVSDWEQRHQQLLDDGAAKDLVVAGLVRDRDARDRQLALLRAEIDRANFAVRKHEALFGRDQQVQLQELMDELLTARNKMDGLRAQLPEEYHSLLD
jgi:hypothetical protein